MALNKRRFLLKKKYENKNEHRTKLYSIWCAMRQRCRNKNNKDYKYYGERCISVCNDWDDFLNFKVWAISVGYKEGLTIDRIDTYGNYEPSNCRWITIQEQQQNRRDAHFITYNGETLNMTQWAKKTGISRSALKYRLNSGWSIEDALYTPLISNGYRKQKIKESN